MAAQEHAPACSHQKNAPFCSIIPPRLLQTILDNDACSVETKAAVQKTYNHVCKVHSARQNREGIAASVAAAAQSFAAAAKPAATAKVYRSLYTSAKTDKLKKTLLFNEGATTAQLSKDTSAKEVYTYFGDTWQFYNEVFKRNSIDDKGLHLVGSVHYDDEPGPPGMDNAFWDGTQMAFGDGDGEIFGSFTKNIDVIGHELTHGVTQYTAELEYEFEAGALNESVSDVFGTMIKQYFLKQKSEDADWLIGEGIFLPSLKNAAALRSMKAPGTAYDNPKIGKDDQPATMDDYAVLPNTAAGDSGGVHTNSGIPNHAFYLASVALGGYSWEKAGKVWYAALLDDKLHGIDTKKAFKVFADLTVQYAKSLFDEETEAAVKKAWTDVKVLTADDTPSSDPKPTDPGTGDGEL